MSAKVSILETKLSEFNNNCFVAIDAAMVSRIN
jgi:hypothetical protein